MAIDTTTYGSNAAITCTIASLASSANAGQGSAVVDNSTNQFIDAILTIAVKTSASALANDKACYVYIYGSGADSVYSGSSSENVGTNAAVTIDSPTNLKGPFVINCPASAQTYRGVWSIASIFGGVMPYKWGFVLRNYTGQALDATAGSHLAEYTGIKYTST